MKLLRVVGLSFSSVLGSVGILLVSTGLTVSAAATEESARHDREAVYPLSSSCETSPALRVGHLNSEPASPHVDSVAPVQVRMANEMLQFDELALQSLERADIALACIEEIEAPEAWRAWVSQSARGTPTLIVERGGRDFVWHVTASLGSDQVTISSVGHQDGFERIRLTQSPDGEYILRRD